MHAARPQSRNLLQRAAGPYKWVIRLVSSRPCHDRLSSETRRESRQGQVSSNPPVSMKSQESLFRHRSFRLLFTTRAAANAANQMQAAAVGWMVYDITG